jgi:endonuclease YncB( thermonuclease family)
MSVKGWLGGIAVFAVVVGACNSGHDPNAAPSAVSSPAAPSTSGPAPALPPATPITASATEAGGIGVTVRRVIDGDTFETTAGDRVRVLGIDSCEARTYGGEQATSTAETYLQGEQVTLVEEPGVDTDRSGRLLRYVTLPSGSDFGEAMVPATHTKVSPSGSDASPARLADLRALDYGVRDCSDPATRYTPPTSSDYDVDVDLGRHGDNGLPDGALTGGYCARKWWC